MPDRREFLEAAAAAGVSGIVSSVQSVAGSVTMLKGSTVQRVPDVQHLQVGAIVFPKMDQIDLTGPFSVLCRMPKTDVQLLWKEKGTLRDHRGLALTPDATFAEVKPIDVLLVPGGPGQQDLMDDEAVLSFITQQAARAKCVFSVCTGALICGAAGLLKGKSATTHWASVRFLKYFGAKAVDQRVVADGTFVSAAGLTAGIDGALTVAALLRGEEAAKAIQLEIQYEPEPPFDCGSPGKASAEILGRLKDKGEALGAARLATAREVAKRLGVDVTE